MIQQSRLILRETPRSQIRCLPQTLAITASLIMGSISLFLHHLSTTSPPPITSSSFFLSSHESYAHKDLNPKLCKPKIQLNPTNLPNFLTKEMVMAVKRALAIVLYLWMFLTFFYCWVKLRHQKPSSSLSRPCLKVSILLNYILSCLRMLDMVPNLVHDVFISNTGTTPVHRQNCHVLNSQINIDVLLGQGFGGFIK